MIDKFFVASFNPLSGEVVGVLFVFRSEADVVEDRCCCPVAGVKGDDEEDCIISPSRSADDAREGRLGCGGTNSSSFQQKCHKKIFFVIGNLSRCALLLSEDWILVFKEVMEEAFLSAAAVDDDEGSG